MDSGVLQPSLYNFDPYPRVLAIREPAGFKLYAGLFVILKKVVILQPKIWCCGHHAVMCRRLKGNQVRILSRPAAVSPDQVVTQTESLSAKDGKAV